MRRPLASNVRRDGRRRSRRHGRPPATGQAEASEPLLRRFWVAVAASVCWSSPAWHCSSRFGFELHQLAHQVAEHFVRLQGLEPAVEVDGGLDIAVPQHAPNGLVIARMCLEPYRCSSMPKLMYGEAKAGGLFNPFGDLVAEGLGILVSTGLAGEQPKLIRAAQQCRPKRVDIFIDQRGQLIVEQKLEFDAVLHI